MFISHNVLFLFLLLFSFESCSLFPFYLPFVMLRPTLLSAISFPFYLPSLDVYARNSITRFLLLYPSGVYGLPVDTYYIQFFPSFLSPYL